MDSLRNGYESSSRRCLNLLAIRYVTSNANMLTVFPIFFILKPKLVLLICKCFSSFFLNFYFCSHENGIPRNYQWLNVLNCLIAFLTV